MSKPKPWITIVDASIAKLVLLLVTTGITVATCTDAPLLTEFVVTTAVMLPTLVGVVDKETVNAVAVAEVTVPTAPLLNVTVLLAAVVSNPKPLIVTVDSVNARLLLLLVTTGAVVAI